MITQPDNNFGLVVYNTLPRDSATYVSGLCWSTHMYKIFVLLQAFFCCEIFLLWHKLVLLGWIFFLQFEVQWMFPFT